MEQGVLRQSATQPLDDGHYADSNSMEGGPETGRLERKDSTDSWPKDKGSIESEGSGAAQPLTSGMLMRSSLHHAREKQNLIRQLVQKNRSTLKVAERGPSQTGLHQVLEGAATPPTASPPFQRAVASLPRPTMQGGNSTSGQRLPFIPDALNAGHGGVAPSLVASARAPLVEDPVLKAVRELEEQQADRASQLLESVERLQQQCEATWVGLEELSRSMESQARELEALRKQDLTCGIGELQRSLAACAAQLQGQGEQLTALRPQETSEQLAGVRKAMDSLSRDVESLRGQDATLGQIRRSLDAQAKEVEMLRAQDIAHCLSEYRRTLEAQARDIESVRAQAREDSLLMKTVKANLEVSDKSSMQRTLEAVQAATEIKRLVEESRDSAATRSQETLRRLAELQGRLERLEQLEGMSRDVELLRGEVGTRALIESLSAEVDVLKAQATSQHAELAGALQQQAVDIAALRLQDPSSSLSELRQALELQGLAIEHLRQQDPKDALEAMNQSLQAHEATLSGLLPRMQELQSEILDMRSSFQVHNTGLAELSEQVCEQHQALMGGHEALRAGLATQAQLQDLRLQLETSRTKEAAQELATKAMREQHLRIMSQVALLEQREQQHLLTIENLRLQNQEFLNFQILDITAGSAAPRGPVLVAPGAARGGCCHQGFAKFIRLKGKRNVVAPLALGCLLLATFVGAFRHYGRSPAPPATVLLPSASPKQTTKDFVRNALGRLIPSRARIQRRRALHGKPMR